jgi:ABC-type dipeptide/oligopeptide/nickel transport system ATPase component
MPPERENPLLSVSDLAVSFAQGPDRLAPRFQAVDGLSLTIYPRQTLAVVGESGCGKSVSALSLLQLLPRPAARVDRGQVLFRTPTVTPGPPNGAASGPGVTAGVPHEPRDLLAMSEREIRAVRGGQIAMIFQEPMSSLNPVFSIGDQIVEAILLHQPVHRRDARSIAVEAMRSVGIVDPERRLNAYPHQFSGGMRQRVMIAMALACKPSLLLADEPTTALDATIQQQILALLRDLKRDTGMAVLLITHDLGVVAENADAVCVMYAGRVVEYASAPELFANPLHPYTRGLLACTPRLGRRRERLPTIAEIIDQPGAFELPCAGAGTERPRPWWPWHEPPRNLAHSNNPASASGSFVLHEVRPDHWVGLWRTDSLPGGIPRPPAINFRVERRDPASPTRAATAVR